jgi:hypothetical protein
VGTDDLGQVKPVAIKAKKTCFLPKVAVALSPIIFEKSKKSKM